MNKMILKFIIKIKFMELLKKLNKQKVKKSLWYIIISIISIFVLAWIYSLIFEQDKLMVDRYNFKQLEKAKLILNKIPKEKMLFYTLKDFNETYKADIKPIKNCYYVNYDNWNKPYIFWFQLESMIYRFIYFWKDYAYPRYSRPNEEVCFGMYKGWWLGCDNDNKQWFLNTISNPCRD